MRQKEEDRVDIADTPNFSQAFQEANKMQE